LAQTAIRKSRPPPPAASINECFIVNLHMPAFPFISVHSLGFLSDTVLEEFEGLAFA